MLELDALLAPIPGTAPAGEDLSFSSEYDTILEARRSDDPTLEQGDWVTDLKSADWQGVAAQTSQLLRDRSKDLRLAVWWAEAHTQLHGFAGLARGYRLVAGLCDQHWDDVHPQVEDGDLEQRIGNLSWLLTHSADWLRKLPLVQASQGRFGLADFEAARARRVDGGDHSGPSLEMLEAARRDTSHEFYVQLMDVVPDCRLALQELEQAVDARLGQDGPSFTAVRDQLDHINDVVRRFAREAGVLVDGVAEDSPSLSIAPGVGGSEPVNAAPAANGAITTRKEAIAQLRRVADFFRRTEPHSPVAYLADKAARWGEMPLHVWLKRVIKDDSTLTQMQELLDIGDADSSND